MVTTLFAWIAIFYTLFSLGDIFVLLYNKLCKNNEKYGILGNLILGICAISILLPLTSLWLPSNEYILFAYIFLSIIHWGLNYRRLAGYFNPVKNFLRSATSGKKILIAIPAVSMLVYMYIFDHFYDAEYYHYQNIRWNEQFAIVPGLGNLEDRFAFNSNYLLISAIFTFRFLFGDGEAIYALQSLVYVVLLTGIVAEFIKSGYKIIYSLLLLLAFLIFFRNSYMFGSSSTDILPILFLFYYITKATLHRDWLKKHLLLACLMPVTLVTYKLSTVIFCIICIFILIYMIKQKRQRELIFILSACALTIGLWCVRNVIISGYLVYPLYYIDLFDPDWKMPKATAMLQQLHIGNYAKEMFSYEMRQASNVLSGNVNSILYISGFINILIGIIILLSPVFIVYKYRIKGIDKYRTGIYLIVFFCIIFSMFTAPDFRFSYGYMLGILFLLFYILLDKKEQTKKSKKAALALIICIMTGFCILSTKKFIDAGDRIGVKYESFIDFAALYHHRNSKNLNSFNEYKSGDFIIYTTRKREDNRTFDLLPATDPNGLPFEPFVGLRTQSIETIELRGESLQDGFRTKKEYIEILNGNIEQYIEQYQHHYTPKKAD